jgi:hypothetical protein
MNADLRHVPDERLLQLVDGELSPVEAGAVRDHLRECPPCQARADRFEASSAAFGDAYRQDREAQGAGAEPVRDALRAQLAEFGKRERGPSWITACVLLAAAILGLEFLSSRSRPPASVPRNRPDLFRPIAYLTPGATRRVAAADLCATRRTAPRAIPAAVRQAVVRDYSMEHVPAREYELDYLITPELGGSDDRRNLWPERYVSELWNARVKDELEQLLPRLVCAGTLPLETAQRDMATDWIAAYKKYFHADRPLHAYPAPAARDGDDGPAIGVMPDLTFDLPAPGSDDIER